MTRLERRRERLIALMMREAGGSFSIVNKALSMRVSELPTGASLDVDDVLRIIRGIRNATGAA